MDPLMLQPTWTTVMAIDLCDGRKYFVELQSFAHRTTGYGNIQGGAIDGSSHASANLDNRDGLICVMAGSILWSYSLLLIGLQVMTTSREGLQMDPLMLQPTWTTRMA